MRLNATHIYVATSFHVAKDVELDLTLKELADSSGIHPRMIRFLIAEAVVPKPHGTGVNARYGPAHLAALGRYNFLLSTGNTPAQARLMLEGGNVRVPVAPGIELNVNSEVAAGSSPREVAAAVEAILIGLLPDKFSKEHN